MPLRWHFILPLRYGHRQIMWLLSPIQLPALRNYRKRSFYEKLVDENVEKMQYRGTRYKADDLDVKQVNVSNKNSNAVKPVIKYRGTSMDSSNSVNTSVSQQTGSLLADQQIQEPAKPKERMKYRGSYIE